MNNSLDLERIADWNDEIPLDEFGYALLPNVLYNKDKVQTENRENAVYSIQATKPLENMDYVIGTHYDYIALDFHLFSNKMVALHAMINYSSLGYTEDLSYQLVYEEDAPEVALGIIDRILEEWVFPNEIAHDEHYWDQDPFYFYRAVSRACGKESPEWKSLRYGAVDS